MPHTMFTLLAAGLVSAALAMAEDRTPVQRLWAAVRVFGGCAIAIVGGGWIMRLIHG